MGNFSDVVSVDESFCDLGATNVNKSRVPDSSEESNSFVFSLTFIQNSLTF